MGVASDETRTKNAGRRNRRKVYGNRAAITDTTARRLNSPTTDRMEPDPNSEHVLADAVPAAPAPEQPRRSSKPDGTRRWVRMEILGIPHLKFSLPSLAIFSDKCVHPDRPPALPRSSPELLPPSQHLYIRHDWGWLRAALLCTSTVSSIVRNNTIYI